MRDAQPREIRDDGSGIGEAESRSELEPVRRGEPTPHHAMTATECGGMIASSPSRTTPPADEARIVPSCRHRHGFVCQVREHDGRTASHDDDFALLVDFDGRGGRSGITELGPRSSQRQQLPVPRQHLNVFPSADATSVHRRRADSNVDRAMGSGISDGSHAECRKLLPAAAAHGLVELVVTRVAEVRERRRCGPFLAHEQQRRERATEQEAGCDLGVVEAGEVCEPLALGSVAHLIVVLGAHDEAMAGEILLRPVERSGDVDDRAVVRVIAVDFAGDGRVQRMVHLVAPLGGEPVPCGFASGHCHRLCARVLGHE